MTASDKALAFTSRQVREPYPGLRPFLDHEHALLKGRDDQIRQVLDRLAKTHFVAIIGGSGSGKSSLIRAGVVPLLRTQAIKQAGDYWIPVVFTPGTTDLSSISSAAPDAAPAPNATESPVSRLAWKFAQTLRPNDQTPVDLTLCGEVASFIRQGAGFSRLVRAYHHLLPRPGPSTDRARFLFVIDQFEELFHPNNRSNPDARAVVDAVIEHFLEPDERAFVIMTMRSEHLADCAAFLHLPDAINRSFYLVRRLNSAEIREVIVEPAQVMQRRVQRGNPEFCEPVEFAPEVVARLLADVRRIEDDPDHLPLLQHLLARVWSSALLRENLPSRDRVPRQVLLTDLEAAVCPGSEQRSGWLVQNRLVNTLRCSLENWAEYLFHSQRSAEQQARLDELLPHLAFKDPNTGLYFQQRVRVDDLKLFADVSKPRELLRALLERGYLDTVNYLYWDDENPAHVTLKVSHEALIRGWARFRKVADVEAERFDEFVAVMRRCALWKDKGEPDELLLESAELERIKNARLNPVFDSDEARKSWFVVLRLYREGERLTTFETSLQLFMTASRKKLARLEQAAKDAERQVLDAREAERAALEKARITEAETARANAEKSQAVAEIHERREIDRRKSAVLAGIIVVASLLLLVGSYGMLILYPAMSSIEQYNIARALTSTRGRSDGSPVEHAAAAELVVLRDAANTVLAGRDGGTIAWLPGAPRANAIRSGLDWLPFVRQQVQQLEMSSSESLVNDELRTLLTSALWRPAQASSEAKLPSPLAPWDCKIPQLSDAVLGQAVFVGGSRDGLFIPDGPKQVGPADKDVLIYNAKRDGPNCSAHSVAFSVPREFKPALIFDAKATVMAVVNRVSSGGQKNFALFNIDWRWNDRARAMTADIRPRRTINSSEAEFVFEAVRDKPQLSIVETRPTRGGFEVELGGNGPWLLLASEAQSIATSLSEPGWQKLKESTAGSPCQRLGETVGGLAAAASSDPSVSNYKDLALSLVDTQGALCFVMQGDGRAAGPGQASEEITVSVYEAVSVRAAWDVDGNKLAFPLLPSVSWKFMNRIGGTEHDWWIGMEGGWKGWLAATSAGKVVAAPFSTEALRNMADALLKKNPQPAARASSAPAGASAPGR